MATSPNNTAGGNPLKLHGKFPRPEMVAAGESSTPFTGAEVVHGYQPYGWNKGVGMEVDYEMWGDTGIGGERGPVPGTEDESIGWTHPGTRNVRKGR